MKPVITTTIPVHNAREFILQTFESLMKQTRRPDRVVVIDNCSTDDTPEIVKNFKGLPIEYFRNDRDLDSFGNFNRCLDFAPETKYLHILHADDMVREQFYERMVPLLEDCDGLGLAWCLDERIDEHNRHLSLSGKPDGRVKVWEKDPFLAHKAEIGNQAFAATLLRTNYQACPERFPLDMLILGDMVFWPKFGLHCKKIITLNEPLALYRWHGSNETFLRSSKVVALVGDEWRSMQEVEALRDRKPGLIRRMKLQGMLAVRAGIKATRIRQRGKPELAREVAAAARVHTGWVLWLMGQVLVQLRELIVFKIGGRRRHPSNFFG